MKHTPPPEIDPPRRTPPPLRAAALVIYLTLALLALAIPQSLTNWLSDMNGNPAQEAALRGATLWQSLAERTGIPAVYRVARDAFIAGSGAEPD